MSGLRVIPSKFEGQVLLVCRKCQKKSGVRKAVAGLKKSLKRLGKRDAEPVRFHVVGVGCMKLCPKGAVTVCDRAGMRTEPVGLTLVRDKDDVRALYEASRT